MQKQVARINPLGGNCTLSDWATFKKSYRVLDAGDEYSTLKAAVLIRRALKNADDWAFAELVRRLDVRSLVNIIAAARQNGYSTGQEFIRHEESLLPEKKACVALAQVLMIKYQTDNVLEIFDIEPDMKVLRALEDVSKSTAVFAKLDEIVGRLHPKPKMPTPSELKDARFNFFSANEINAFVYTECDIGFNLGSPAGTVLNLMRAGNFGRLAHNIPSDWQHHDDDAISRIIISEDTMMNRPELVFAGIFELMLRGSVETLNHLAGLSHTPGFFPGSQISLRSVSNFAAAAKAATERANAAILPASP
jgi:hypothetical protein